MYPVVFLDALRVKIRDEGVVRNKAIYLALGVRRDGTRDVLGLWIEQTEGPVVSDLKLRGAQDIPIAVVDGLKGLPETINSVFPETTIRTGIVHLIRTRWTSPAGKTGNRSRRHSRRSIGHCRSKRPPWRGMRSKRAHGVRNTHRLPHSGAGPGIG
ncbi:transposase [Burkholderia lata]|uniref:Mutator family transposase n=1 Tax=Burkholderia lata (strain ATCC 17760 / DSM 23089 / LMG 22485 / NCIMB 9086 / R18194 / 383) TaxID=482957 RepID=A0A6P2Z521_BURL3|nr:transposase [Burkholderia lata]